MGLSLPCCISAFSDTTSIYVLSGLSLLTSPVYLSLVLGYWQEFYFHPHRSLAHFSQFFSHQDTQFLSLKKINPEYWPAVLDPSSLKVHSNDICQKKSLNRLKLTLWKSRVAILIAVPLPSCKILSSTMSTVAKAVPIFTCSTRPSSFVCIRSFYFNCLYLATHPATLKPSCKPTKVHS